MSDIDKYISLGYSCGPKFFISTILKEEYYVFDYLGSSMWSIIELLNNNFKDFINESLIKKMEITKNNYIYTNKKYYIRFLHDFDARKKESLYNKYFYKKLENAYTRRIFRFLNLFKVFNTNSKILGIIRTQEPTSNRIIYDEYKDKFEKSEYFYLCEFSNLLKHMYPQLKFIILYINYFDDLKFDEKYNIISFYKDDDKDTMGMFVPHVNNILKNNNDFINDSIKKLYYS